MHKLLRKPRPLLAAATIAGLLGLAGTASAQATMGEFYSQETNLGTDVSLCTGLTTGSPRAASITTTACIPPSRSSWKSL